MNSERWNFYIWEALFLFATLTALTDRRWGAALVSAVIAVLLYLMERRVS